MVLKSLLPLLRDLVQLLLPMSIPRASADSHLTMAISDLIHSRGLPFSLGSDAKFRKVLTLAKNASMTYKPPGRNQIATDLLDLNYTLYMGKNFEELMNDADIYGIAFLVMVQQLKRLHC